MKKLLIPLLLCLLMIPSAFAETRVFDRAGVLTAEDERMLEQEIAKIQSEYQFDVVILTETDIGGQAAYRYTEQFYDGGSFGFGENRDGILLLIVTGSRDYDICTTGSAKKIFTESAMEKLDDAMLPYLRRNAYSSGISQFVRAVSDRLNAYQPPNRALRVLPFSLLGGLAVGLIVSLVLRHQMKTVRRRPDAASYIREGSARITRSEDVYLYTTTTRRRIETSSGRGGGHSHGGGGGHTHHGGKF